MIGARKTREKKERLKGITSGSILTNGLTSNADGRYFEWLLQEGKVESWLYLWIFIYYIYMNSFPQNDYLSPRLTWIPSSLLDWHFSNLWIDLNFLFPWFTRTLSQTGQNSLTFRFTRTIHIVKIDLTSLTFRFTWTIHIAKQDWSELSFF